MWRFYVKSFTSVICRDPQSGLGNRKSNQIPVLIPNPRIVIGVEIFDLVDIEIEILDFIYGKFGFPDFGAKFWK